MNSLLRAFVVISIAGLLIARAAASAVQKEGTQPAAAAAAPDDAASAIEARFAALERRLAAIAAENTALRQTVEADARLIKQLVAQAGKAAEAKPAPAPAVTIGGKESKLTLSGLMQVVGEAGGAPDARFAGLGDRFQLRRLRVAFAGAFAEDIAFKIESEFGNAAIAGNAAYRAQIVDAFVTWTKYPAFKLQAGQFKTPFGYEQLISDPKTFFVERTLTNDKLTVGRQIGALASGDLLDRRLAYSLGLFNGNGVNNGANDNSKFMSSGRLAAVAFDGKRGGRTVRWTVAGNFFNTADKGAFTGRRTGYGLDMQLVAGPAEFGAEWLRNVNRPVTGPSVTAAGWNACTVWNVTPRWQAVLRYDDFDSNTALPNTTTREWTYGLNYLLKGDDLKFSLNYLRGDTPTPAPSPNAGRLIGRVQVVF